MIRRWSARDFRSARAGVDHLTEIVRRNVGRHADGDSAGAVDQEIRELRRQNQGHFFRAVVFGLKSTVSLSMSSIRVRHLGHAHFGVTGSRGSSPSTEPNFLAVDQRKTHRKILRHADERVVHRHIAMRMIFTDHVTDDARHFRTPCPFGSRSRASQSMRRCTGLARRAHPAAPAPRSRSWRNRGRCASSHLGSIWDEWRAPAPRRGCYLPAVSQRGNPRSSSLLGNHIAYTKARKPPLTSSRAGFFLSFFQ